MSTFLFLMFFYNRYKLVSKNNYSINSCKNNSNNSNINKAFSKTNIVII